MVTKKDYITDFLDSPVFICGAPRSGTTLLSNLLDGHSELLVLPNETHILQHFKAYKGEARKTFFLRDYLFTDDILVYSSPAYREKINESLAFMYGAGSAWDLSLVDSKTFIETYAKFLKENEISLEVLYKAITLSLFSSYTSPDKSSHPKSFVEKRPLDNEISAIILKEHFPKAKFVHILRDPRTRYASAKRRRIISRMKYKYCPRLNDKDFVRGHAEISMLSFVLAKRNKFVLGDDYLVINYEDLTSQPNEIMKTVAAFLTLPWQDVLLIQTCLGNKMGSSSSFKTALDGITATDVDRMKAYNSLTTGLERMIVNFYNRDVAQEFGYDLGEGYGNYKAIPTLSLIRPARYELPLHYLRNRLAYLKQIWTRTSAQVVEESISQILSKWECGIPTQD
ncbi:MAG: hypothetical protein CL875_03070 [Dehalococcoidales bacterium]|jgi:hypothetical protein|nr:hypothetical protein [Dehalococcoidales bacterium]MAF85452.1 hypothetical protein [Dehalococcoidales bacterium]